MIKTFIKLTMLLSLATTTAAFAETETATEPLESNATAVNYEDNITGVNYEVDENGEFVRIRSSGEAELEIGDRKDIRTATQKASLRAKANIAKFLSERVTSDEVMDNIDKTLTKTNGAEKSVSRDTVSEYVEKISNSADALLKGVITTKTDVNKDEKYVLVEVGISKKTMQAANIINKKLNDNSEGSAVTQPLTPNVIENNGGGREIKKAKNYDNF